MNIRRREFLYGVTGFLGTNAFQLNSLANNNTYDAAILGAGLAGLNAARLLERKGLRIVIIEGNNRVGGKLLTARHLNGNQEIGGSSIGSGYERLTKLIDELKLIPYNPYTKPIFNNPNTAIHLNGSLISTRDEWARSNLNPFSEELKQQYPWERLRKIIDEINPLSVTTDWFNKDFFKYDISLKRALEKHGLGKEEINLITEINPAHGDTADSISVLQHFFSSMWVKDQRKKMTKEKPPFFQIQGGNSLIPEKMASSLKGDLRLNFMINTIESNRQGVTIHNKNGEKIHALTAITTLPLSSLSKVKIITPFQEQQKIQAIRDIKYSRVHTILFEILKPFWEFDNLPLTYWTDTEIGRIFTAPGSDGNPAYIKTWVTGLAARTLDNMQSKDAIKFVLSKLIAIRPSYKDAIKPSFLWSWQNTLTAGGTYVAWQPGQIKSYSNLIAKPIPPLFFAGEYTAKTDRGMEGAMESGERAAIEVLQHLGNG